MDITPNNYTNIINACCRIISTPQNIARWAYHLYSPNGLAISESVRIQLKTQHPQQGFLLGLLQKCLAKFQQNMDTLYQ